jgi:integrase
MGSVSWRKRGSRYLVYWRLDDGSQGGKTVATPDEARNLAAQKRLEIATGAWKGRQRGKLTVDRWADDWWEAWSASPSLSPNTLAMADSRLRNHVRPFLGRRPIEDVTPRLLRQWQAQVLSRGGYPTVMACRSLLFRILRFAEDEGAIPANPMRKVPAPRPPVDPDALLGTSKPRVLTPQEAGVLLAAFPPFWWDHIVTLLGTGLRIGELAGLRRRRVDLSRGVLQVVDTRYQAGKYGSGFKGPKSVAGVREVPLPPQVAAAIMRRLPPGSDPGALVFTGPGRAGAPPGTRTVLNARNFRRLFLQAVARSAEPTAALRPTDRRVLAVVGSGSRSVDELVDALAAGGRRRLRPATVHAALTRLATAGLVTAAGTGSTARWSAVRRPAGPLARLDLGGPHDLRHTYATWLEDAGIPARVIDQLMGHAGGHTPEQGSRIGRAYRETTAEMRGRVVAALEQRLSIVLAVAVEQAAQQAAGRSDR